MRLYADPDADQDLVRDAEDVIELSGHISADPETENEMDGFTRAATNALEKVVDAASGRLRATSPCRSRTAELGWLSTETTE